MKDVIEKYWVVGGHYTSTEFDELSPNYELEEYGPFSNEKEAKEKLSELSQKTVDNCKYKIVVDLSFLCSEEERKLIELAAKKENKTISDFMVSAIEDYLKEYYRKYPYSRQDFKDISK